MTSGEAFLGRLYWAALALGSVVPHEFPASSPSLTVGKWERIALPHPLLQLS